jgi:hypothetical protein
MGAPGVEDDNVESTDVSIGGMHAVTTIPRRFCGPPDSANGGYTAGILASALAGAVEVTLRHPPPLERELALDADGTRAWLRDGETVVAEAVAVRLDLDVPEPVAAAVAAAASARSRTRLHPETHPFPTCFACGPARTAPDGLRLFAGPVAGTELFAVPWSPAEVTPEVVWAALDRPRPHVLGRIAGRIDRMPATGEQHVIMSWRIGRDGRKLFAGSAIFGPDRGRRAAARATWIELR